MFGTAIDYEKIRIRRRKWFPFQPRDTIMAPRGHLHFHPGSTHYCDDFGAAPLGLQGLFIHEMVHVWQHQQGISLPLRRLPFSRYTYRLKPGKPLRAYGIEQQAEIVRHAFLRRSGASAPGSERRAYDAIVAFPGAG
ncbi:MAG: vgr related protein [Candidatus Andeanibacterium colombiense]|uniref:Vgr related protein n=1 Tax=Candidatus Andeanibacterium colombiense TaxID=3121345 RepID=A0AAJ5X9H3_9SPHN|nr:MAG: vgr related protein [Sphingomonadaceae bacterium]